MTDKTHDPDSPAARLSGISSDLPGHDATKSSWAFLIRFELNSELNVDFICSLFSFFFSSFLLHFFTSSLLIILWPFLRSRRSPAQSCCCAPTVSPVAATGRSVLCWLRRSFLVSGSLAPNSATSACLRRRPFSLCCRLAGKE